MTRPAGLSVDGADEAVAPAAGPPAVSGAQSRVRVTDEPLTRNDPF